MKPELELSKQISDYISLQYPDIIFHFDFGSGLRMTIGQAKVQKYLNKGIKYPDLFIAEPTGKYHGLFIELKPEGTKLYNRNGSKGATPHLEEQRIILVKLFQRGYYADFGVGFDNTKNIIDFYLQGK